MEVMLEALQVGGPTALLVLVLGTMVLRYQSVTISRLDKVQEDLSGIRERLASMGSTQDDHSRRLQRLEAAE